MTGSGGAVVVRIGVLAVEGVPLAGPRTFADRLETELGRLIAERGLPASLSSPGEHERLRTPVLPVLPAGLSARRLASAVYDGLASAAQAGGGRP